MIKVRNNQVGRKTIDIDLNESVTISLRDQQYDELLKALEVSMAEKIINSDARTIKANKRADTALDFIKEIRNVFYDMEGDFFILRRDLEDIPLLKLDEVLEKYNEYLGFE
ncbi:hypothetical protein ACMGDK_11600 [Chryseobacterium sp. DT-3]|uniref:hypothetical protein n=1 Tax=Chryseobacterium sp. DT-3 TaxID=3396164 RepID=UPI003F1DCFA8